MVPPPVTAFLEQHVGSVYRFALRLTGDPRRAEDVTQETMLRAWRHLEARSDRAVSDAMTRPWLLRIAANAWRDELRRQRSRGRREATPRIGTPPWPDPDQGVVRREELDRVLAAMDQLPPRQRQVLHLVACEQLPLSAVAEVLGISVEAAKASLSLARQAVRARLGVGRERLRPRERTAR